MKFTNTLSYATVHLNIVRIYVSTFINWYILFIFLQNSVKSDIYNISETLFAQKVFTI